MASQLHEAVRLAQSGQRDDARNMLRQVVQSDPNNEMAWLWLASVAADQVEYERALTEVLRVNPGSQQARDLLNQFRQQYRTPPPQTPPAYQTPPPQAAYQAPPPQQRYDAPPSAQPAYYGAPQGYVPPVAPAATKSRKKSRGCGCNGCGCGGCGCIPTCLIITVILILLPLGSLIGLGVAGRSLGPLDLISEFLPGEAGRKDVSFTYQQPNDSTVYNVSANVPRGWFVASEVQNDFWEFFADILDEVLPLAANGSKQTPSWHDQANDYAPPLLEANPAVLADAGSFIGGEIKSIVELGRLEIATFACEDVEGLRPRNKWADFELPVNFTSKQIFRSPNGLCGMRIDAIRVASDTRAFENINPPDENYEVIFLVPIDEQRAALWVITVPEPWYNRYSADITKMIESIEISEQSR